MQLHATVGSDFLEPVEIVEVLQGGDGLTAPRLADHVLFTMPPAFPNNYIGLTTATHCRSTLLGGNLPEHPIMFLVTFLLHGLQ